MRVSFLSDNELNKKFEKLDNYQKTAVLKKIEFMLSPDNEDEELSAVKNKIYEKYSKCVSKLIAKLEVYNHDLPDDIRGYIETTFRLLSSSSKYSGGQAIKICEYTYNFQIFLVNTLYIKLTDLYLKEIKKYKRVFKTFNYKGIKYEGENKKFIDFYNEEIKKIKLLKRKGKKQYKNNYKRHKDELNDGFQVNVVSSKEIFELEKAYKTAEKLLEEAEKYYPSIISNGTTNTIKDFIIFSFPTIVSVVFTIFGVIILVKEWLLGL